MRTKKLRGFTLVELLVVIAIIGVLVALLLPAIQAARESARRNQCVNNLKQMGLALQMHHDAKQLFPQGRNGSSPGPGTATTPLAVSWAFELLPYMEQNAIHDALVNTVRIDDLLNATAIRSPVEMFYCPSRRQPAADRNFDNNDSAPASEHQNVAAGGDYAGSAGLEEDFGRGNEAGEPPGIEGGALYSFSRINLRQVTDGTALSLAVGEKYIPTEEEVLRGFPGTEPERMHFFQRDTAYFSGDNPNAILAGTECGMAHGAPPAGSTNCGIEDLNEQFGSEHPGISNFVFLDGHVQAIQQSVDAITLQRISTIADDQVIDASNL